MKQLLTISFCIFCSLVHGQKALDVTSGAVNAGAFFISVNGEPILTTKFSKLVEGSQYFIDDWAKGNIVMPHGTTYKDIDVKLDLVSQEVHYKDDKGRELVANTALKDVYLKSADGLTMYHFVHSSYLEKAEGLAKGWYQLLSAGAAGLYKEHKKTVNENKPYGSATTEQRIQTKEQYIVVFGGKATVIKKVKDLPSVLSEKKVEMEKFISSQDQKTASLEERLLAAVEHFNSLMQQQNNE